MDELKKEYYYFRLDYAREKPYILEYGGYMSHGGEMDKGGKYYVIDAKDGKTLSKGFDTEDEAKVEMYEIFENSNNPFLTIKKMARGGYMADGGKTTVVDEFGSMSFKEQKDDYEMIVISKEAEKDGGRIHKDRFLVFAKDIKEAKQIAEDLWRENFGDTDLSIVKVMSDEAYRFNKMNGIDSYAKGGEVETILTVPKYMRDEIEESINLGYDELVVGMISKNRKGVLLVNDNYEVRGTYDMGLKNYIENIIANHKKTKSKGGYMAHGGSTKFAWQNAQVGDSVLVIAENKMGTIVTTYGRRIHVRFPDGSEKTYFAEDLEFISNDEFADGGEIMTKAKYYSDNPNWTNDKLLKEYNESKFNLREFEMGYLKPSKVIGTGYKSSAIAKKLAKNYLEERVDIFKNALEMRGVIAKGGELNYISKNEIENVTVIYKGKQYAISSNDIITGAYKFAKGGLSDNYIYIPKRDVVKVTTKDGESIKSPLNGVWVKKDYFESEKPSSNYVVISEKGAYTYIMSKPTTKQDAEKLLKETTIPRGEVGKVITVDEAKGRKKVVGRKYLTQSAKKGIVVTSIKDIPNFQERLDEGKITYRGLGLGKLYNDFYDVAGESGYRIKVDGKEYYITETEFNSFSRGSDGKLRVKFDAPYRKFEDGGVLSQSDFDSLKKGDKISITFSSPIKRENEVDLMVKSKTLVNKGKRNEKEKITFVNLANPSGVKFYAYKDTDDNYIGFAIGDLAIYNVKLTEKFAKGGKIGFEALSKKVASNYVGKKVPSKYKKEYGETYDKAEAKEVGDKVAAKVYRQQLSKMEKGGSLEDATYLARMAEEYAEKEYGKKVKPTSTTMKASKLPNGKNYYTEITVVFTDGSKKTFEQEDFEDFFDVDDYAKGGELAMGIKTEMEEHGMSKSEATKTAKDHLREHPNYYSKMKKAGLEHGGAVEFFDYSNADLEKLPYRLDKYFTKPKGTVRIPLDKIKPIRAREKGVKNANKFMRDAYDGKMEKREPITVYKSAKKGHYILKDGNSTYANAKFSGWKDIYAVVVKNEKLSASASKTTANSVLTLAKKIRKEGEKWQDAIQRAKKMRNESIN